MSKMLPYIDTINIVPLFFLSSLTTYFSYTFTGFRILWLNQVISLFKKQLDINAMAGYKLIK